MAHMLAAVLMVVAAIAADVNGTWRGTLTPDGREPTPALLVLRQEGSTVTGTAGASEDADRHPIRNGTINGDVVTFDLEMGEGSMRFELKLDGDNLTGAVVREREGQQQKATLLVNRVK